MVTRCEVAYTGRGRTFLPEGIRLLMWKSDGTFMVWSDGGQSAVKPQNGGSVPPSAGPDDA
jgi:RecB family endonuclease NucS